VGRGNKNIREIFDIRIRGHSHIIHFTAHFQALPAAVTLKFNFFVLGKRYQALKLETA
jgi:hypothetical protein